MENEKKQKMLIDKKEIEEMIKNELNMNNLMKPSENSNDIKVDENKDNANDDKKENNENNNIKENINENK